MNTTKPPRPAVFLPDGALYAFSFPNFSLFFWGQSVSVIGTWMQMVAQQWVVYHLTGSSEWLGIVAGAGAIPYIALAVWGGQIADRVPRRTILLATQTASMTIAIVLFGLATNRIVAVAPWHIAVLAGLGGVVNAFNMPAQQSLVTELVGDPKAVPNAIALSSLRFNTARFVGPALAGIVLVNFGAVACFAVNAVSFVAVLLSLYFLRLPERERSVDVTTTDSSPWEGLRFLLSVASLRRVIILTATASLLLLSVSTLYPVLASHYVRSAAGFSTVVTMTLMRTFTATLVCLFIAGVGMVVYNASTNTKVQLDAPAHLRGRVMAMYALVINALMPTGGLFLGFLAARFGVLMTIRGCAGVTLAVIVWLWAARQAGHRHVASVNSPE